ncbi:pha synthase subunit protein [Rhodanobacter denitrificans]|uniref:Poly(3-hydroxyalkanoate) polymerase subunit PhaE n=1 Tax=Rhodanobacter denitrificans TaxID=666685 RepID=A0A368KDT8_9GAMM|nr:poly(R)-hydroxyalkanoic acid synthase subunit PhaE [Rhodanobacter denitrificans]RCS30080.1 pha synthase subunit protein [Rhodanobacter denitrificans]
MTDPANDFIRDYQTLAQQSWDAWSRQFQPQPAANPFAPPPAPIAGNDMLERALTGLKGYFDWMQAAAAGSTAAQPGSDWRQQLQQMFGSASQPFAQAFGGIDSAGAEGFARQWQSWLQAARHGGFGDLPGAHGPAPAFGLNREQQMQQQAMATALLEAMQASARYQELIQRANTQGMQRLQEKLAQYAEPGRQIDSLKGLYDLWVDASEEAYAGIALSEEFREVYGEMVNTQMRVRKLQQQQTEQLCQQLGVPTRSEVSSLGERLQAMRRELAALKRQLAGNQAAATAKATPVKPAAAAKKAPAKAARKPAAKSVPSPRKRQ